MIYLTLDLYPEQFVLVSSLLTKARLLCGQYLYIVTLQCDCLCSIYIAGGSGGCRVNEVRAGTTSPMHIAIALYVYALLSLKPRISPLKPCDETCLFVKK